VPLAPRRANGVIPAGFPVRSPVHSAVYVNGGNLDKVAPDPDSTKREHRHAPNAKPAKLSASAAPSPRLRTNLEFARQDRANNGTLGGDRRELGL
jgi:hypothetical protein